MSTISILGIEMSPFWNTWIFRITILTWNSILTHIIWIQVKTIFCLHAIKSDPLFRLPSIFSHEKDYPFVFHTRMRNFQKKCLANILQKVAILFNLAAFSLVGSYSSSLHCVDVSTPKNLQRLWMNNWTQFVKVTKNGALTLFISSFSAYNRSHKFRHQFFLY